jgi:hypothetical protein
VEQNVKEVGPKTEVDGILDLLARRLCGALGYELIPFMVEAEAGSEPFLSPPKYEAFAEHQLGYEMFSYDAAASFKHQMAAYALDTTLVRALVAAVYVAPNRSVKDSLVTFAQSRRHLLTRQGKLDLDILVAGRKNDAEAQLRAIREAANLDPGGLYSVIQSWFALRQNLPREALDATKGYDPYVEWRYSDAHRYWRERAMAYHMLGNFEAELTEAQEGRKQYPHRAGLLFAEVRALVALGRFNDVLEVLYQATGFPEDPTPAMLLAGEELRAHGFLEESKEAFGMAIDWLNAMPKKEGEESHDIYLAEALYGVERWGDAQEVALALAEESPEDLTALGLVGSTAARLGDWDLATEISDRLGTMEDLDRPGERLLLRAKIAAVLGETDRALRFFQEAFSEGMGFGLRLHRDMDLESIRDRAEYQALMRPKG